MPQLALFKAAEISASPTMSMSQAAHQAMNNIMAMLAINAQETKFDEGLAMDMTLLQDMLTLLNKGIEEVGIHPSQGLKNTFSQTQKEIYEKEILPNLKAGKSLATPDKNLNSNQVEKLFQKKIT